MSTNKYTKYGYKECVEIISCAHCKKENSYNVSYHYEDRARKKDGSIIIPLVLAKTKCYDESPSLLCDKCKLIPKCEDCRIILCNWKRHYNSHPSIDNPKVCEYCQMWRANTYPHLGGLSK